MSQEPSGLYKSVASLGNALALGAALLATPLAFDATKPFLSPYFRKTWGRDMADILLWVVAGVEAYMIYAAVSFLVTAIIVWVMTALATRRFRD